MGNMIKQTGYSLVINKLKSPIQTLENLNVGDGGIISYNGQKIGAYKKSKDEIICVKPYCTHLGCELSWNQLEKTWDCPCHGSRFDYKKRIPLLCKFIQKSNNLNCSVSLNLSD